MNRHKTGPTKINPEVVKTMTDVGRYIQQFGLKPRSYMNKGDAAILSDAIAEDPDALKEYKKTAKEAVDNDRNWGVYKNVGNEKKPEPNTADPYQERIGDFFDLPVPDTDEKNREKESKLEYILDGAKKVLPAAAMAALYFSSPVADISPAAATPDISGDDDDHHHSPANPANSDVKDDISNFMDGLKDKILENSPIPAAAAAEDILGNPEQGKPDLVVTNIEVTDYDEKTGNYRIKYTIENKGTETADNDFLVGIYLDKDPNRYGQYKDIETGKYQDEWAQHALEQIDLQVITEGLAPGESRTIEVDKDIEHKTGNPVKIWVDDVYSKVDESDENNNKFTHKITPPTDKKPDLEILEIGVEDDAKPYVVVKNNGTLRTPVDLDITAVKESADGGRSKHTLYKTFEPGEEKKFYFTGNMLDDFKDYVISVDHLDYAKESNENNNRVKISDWGDIKYPKTDRYEYYQERLHGDSSMEKDSGLAKIAVGGGIAAAVSGAIAYIRHSRHKKIKGRAKKARHPKPDNPKHESKEQEPSQRDGIHSIGYKMHSIEEMIAGKMQHSYDSLIAIQ